MAKGHRSQVKRERNAQKDTRPSATLSYARVSVQKACFVLDAVRGKDLETALGIVTYNPRWNQQQQMLRTITEWTRQNFMLKSATLTRARP